MGLDIVGLVVARLVTGLDVPEVLFVSLDVLFVLGLGVLIDALLGHKTPPSGRDPASCRFSFH